MLKKLLLTLLTLSLAICILFVSIKSAYVNPCSSFAMASLNFSVSPVASQEAVKKVDYYLVYPGILPDHPLYKIKMIRDRIKIFLTRDHLARSQLYLLLADKRVGAGKVLIEGNKVSLGLSTILKGSQYLQKAIVELSAASQEGKDVEQLRGKLEKAALKYEEIFSELKDTVNSEGKATFEELIRTVQTLRGRILGQSF